MTKPADDKKSLLEGVKNHPLLAVLVAVVSIASGVVAIKTNLFGPKSPEKVPSAQISGDHASIQQAQGNGTNNMFTGNVGTVNTGSAHSIPTSEKEAARQRLHDDGIDYDEERYSSALRNHETDVMALFTQSGMLLGRNMAPFVNNFFSQDMASVLLQIDQSPSCPTDYSAVGFYTALQGEPLAFVREICSKDAVRERLKKTTQKAEQDLAIARHDDELNTARFQHDIAMCEQVARETWGNRVSATAAHENCIMNTIPPKKESIRAEEQVAQLNAELKLISE